MAQPNDASEVADLAVRMNLVAEQTARELLFELEDRRAPAADFVRLMERKSLLTPLQSTKILKGDTDGYFLGGYRLLYKIASGSFGRVYRGDDPRSGQIVAVKVLRRRWTEDPKRVESFEREGRIGMTLDHPNIVRLLAVNKDAATGQHFIVMEFVEGDNLKNILNARKKLEVDEALNIMEECADGLAYAWARGLTHRDIKASNILMGTDKIAKLVDFGLAEIHSGATLIMTGVKNTDEEQADRTVDYAGLERATGVKSGDIRSDIYFLGHVLFELMTGIPLMPLTKDKHARMSRRRFEDVETTLGRMAQDHNMPQSAVKVIAKAVALEPTQRYQTPAIFVEAIRTARAELRVGVEEAKQARRASGMLTVYVVESNAKLQDAFRDRFKKMGFRVLMSMDASQAFKRYQTQPYHALVIDVGTAGSDGVDAYRRVLNEAAMMNLDMSGVLILNEDQKAWGAGVATLPGGTVLVRPVTMKQLADTLAGRLPELVAE